MFSGVTFVINHQIDFNGSFTNQGTIINNGNLTLNAVSFMMLVNSGTFINNGTFGNAGTVSNSGTITGSGTFVGSNTLHVVTFNLGGGSHSGGQPLIQAVVNVDNASQPAGLTRSGFVFEAWDGSYTNVTSSRTITAQWVAPVTFTSVSADGTAGTTTTSELLLNFSANPTSLTASHVTVSGGVTVTGISGTGNTRSVDISGSWLMAQA